MIALSFALLLAAQVTDESPQNDPLAVQAMRNFALCAARRTPGGAERLLAMDFRQDAYREALRRYAQGHRNCAAGGRIGFAGVLFAGGLAEALLRQRGRVDLTSFTSVNPARPVEARSAFERAALCTVRAAPQETQGLLAAEPTSEAEAAAVRALTPAVTRCVPQGQEVRMNTPGLRALLALAAYRLVQRDAASPAAGN